MPSLDDCRYRYHEVLQLLVHLEPQLAALARLRVDRLPAPRLARLLAAHPLLLAVRAVGRAARLDNVAQELLVEVRIVEDLRAVLLRPWLAVLAFVVLRVVVAVDGLIVSLIDRT